MRTIFSSRLLSENGINYVTQTEIHTVKPSPVLSRLKLLLKRWKYISRQVLI